MMMWMLPNETFRSAAKKFAADSHTGQVRKFNGEPYCNHCFRVSDNARQFFIDHVDAADPDYLTIVSVVGYWHDIIEDTDETRESLSKLGGVFVADRVWELTNRKTGRNRAESKRIYRDQIRDAHVITQVCKLMDMRDNLPSMMSNHPSPTFRLLYHNECLEMLKCLDKVPESARYDVREAWNKLL